MSDNRLNAILGSGNRFVDVGCESGQLLGGVINNFEQRIGLDVSRRTLEELAGEQTEGWEFRGAGRNESFPLEEDYAGIVVAKQVIEHIVKLIKAIGKIRRLVWSCGRCVITTLNIRHVINIAYIFITGSWPRTAGVEILNRSWDDGYLYYVAHRDIRELLSHVGFQEVSSPALTDIKGGRLLRGVIDRYALALPIREFVSGSILLFAAK